MSGPFFTVAIPTKNRPDRVADALKSVLAQTFTDFEVILCDNSDASEAGATAAVVEALGDSRVRYVRTDGLLSMPDNWEHAISDARGEYVGILTDRSVFRRDALQVVHDEIDETGAQLVTWFNDLYGKSRSGKEFKRRSCTLKRYRHSSEAILDYFLHGNPKYSTKVIPKLMTSFCHRSILEAIRKTPVGRCCPPVAPDFTSGFLMLAHCDWVLTLDECLYVSCGRGNGSDFRRGGELADRFRRDLGMEAHEIVDRMPSDACFSHALVLNDLMRMRDAIPELLPGLEIDRAQYYLGCLNDYVKAARHGATRDVDLASLLEALDEEPDQTKEYVRRTNFHKLATAPSRIAAGAAPAAEDSAPGRAPEKLGAVAAPPPPEFETVFDAMAWDAAHPREPASTSLMELQYGLDQLIKKPRARDAREGVSPAAKVAMRAAAKAKARAEAQAHARAEAPPAPRPAVDRIGTRLRGLLNLGRASR